MFSPVGMTVYVNEIIYLLCIKVYRNVILLKFDIHNIFQNTYSPDLDRAKNIYFISHNIKSFTQLFSELDKNARKTSNKRLAVIL